MQSAADIIEAFGGSGAFAAIINVSPSNATNMKVRGMIPATYFRAIVDAAKERGIDGIDLDKLADLAAQNWNRGAAA